jgi:hypothetical protein
VPPHASAYGLDAGKSTWAISFLRFRRELLLPFDRDATAFPTPRTWEFASKIVKGGASKEVERELIKATVGEGAAVEFSGFLEKFRSLPNIDSILRDPTKEPVLGDPASLYAIASALARVASDTNFDSIHSYLERMPSEFSVRDTRKGTLRTNEQKRKRTPRAHDEAANRTAERKGVVNRARVMFQPVPRRKALNSRPTNICRFLATSFRRVRRLTRRESDRHLLET